MTQTIRNLLMAFTLILTAPLALAGGMYGGDYDKDKGEKDKEASQVVMEKDKDTQDTMSDETTKEGETD